MRALPAAQQPRSWDFKSEVTTTECYITPWHEKYTILLFSPPFVTSDDLGNA